MRVFIYSPQYEISYILSEALTDCNTMCIPFRKISHIQDTIHNSKTNPDLIILDYLSFNHDAFSIVYRMMDENVRVPIVFYNDPVMIKKTRIGHWKEMILRLQPCREIIDDNKYDPIFIKLQNLVESDELRPYLPLMTKPLEIPKEMIKDNFTLQYMKEKKGDFIYEFKKRTNLPENLFYLLALLHSNRDKALSYTDISDLYKEDERKISYESLKVMMSKLKSAIRNDKQCNFIIGKKDNKFRFIVFRTR